MDFFFYTGSTYTYLTVNRIEALAGERGVAVRWRPFDVRSIMIEQNNRPFVGKPVKTKYMWRDIERRADRLGIPFASIPDYPVDPDNLTSRLALVAAAGGWCPAFVKASYRDWFLRNVQPGVVQPLRGRLAELGQDPDLVLEQADGQAIRDRLTAETELAKSMGIFGSPTFAVGTEIFWGDDRLEEALDWALR
jgi:2-hydroxychromene-2-carboxylate isomerase